MKLGVNLINFGPGASPDSLEGWVDMAQGLGYHGLLTSDHVTITNDVSERYPAPFYEPLSILGWLAAMTSEMMIGTTVSVLPYRSPLETARAFANVDQLSRGRCILGVGSGWAAEEFRILGVPFEHRGAMTTEYLEAIKALWATDVASFHGEFVSFDEVHTAPRPVQTPHPPIWVGGNSVRSMRRAIQQGTAWHPIRPTVSDFVNVMLPAFVELSERLELPMPDLCPRIRLRVTDTPRPNDVRLAGEGSLGQIRSDLATFEELGCTWILLDTYHDYLVDELADPQRSWDMFEAVATEIFDLSTESLR
jgi:probable F420-dependent oxidoreductase